MKKIASMMLLLLTLAACTKDPETKKEIVLDKNTATEQTIYADQTSTAKGISFHADAPWFVTVKEVATKAADNTPVDWITLSQYEGGAGDFTLTLTVKENKTQADRKAEISIVCGTTVIRIMIEQKATKENGEEMKPAGRKVKSIKGYELEDGHTAENVTEDYFASLIDFHYDASGRITEVNYKEKNYVVVEPVQPILASISTDGFSITNYHFNYLKDEQDGHDIIRISKSTEGDFREDISLDKNGRAYEVELHGGYRNYLLEYNKNNEIINTTFDCGDGRPDTRKMQWTNGNITECSWKYGQQGGDYTITYDNAVENNAYIDLANFMCFASNKATALMHATEAGNMLNCFGKRTKNMPARIVSKSNLNGDTGFKYKTDAEGNITTIIVLTESFETGVMFIEYE